MAAVNKETIMTNVTNIAKDVVKRAPEHKELILKFIRTFEQPDRSEDIKYGRRKYQIMLQQAVNNQIGTIFIDLNDVEEFCKKELLGEDSLQVQQAIESLVTDIEQNSYRYQRFFYDACDKLQPARDAGYKADGAAMARDAVQSWRERMSAQQAMSPGASSDTLPLQIKNTWNLRFSPRSSGKTFRLREIKADTVGALVKLECTVVRVSQVKPKVEVVTYHCEVCGSEIFQSVDGERYTPPKECPSQRCKDNKQAGKLRCNIRTCAFTRHQDMKVQEMSEHVPTGGVPRSINVLMNGDLTRAVLPGDAITLTGVYMPHDMPFHVRQQMGTSQEMYLEAHCIQKHKKGYSEVSEDSELLEHKINEIASKGNIYDIAAKSIAPEIFGHADVKRALLIVLIGSFTKKMGDGMKVRGDIHSLLMGDPGVAKSQLMKQVCAIAPRSVYTTGKGSSGVGLTASVVRDDKTGEVSLEGGALVLADMGVCCIDEFDKMEESDRTAIHEVMEQQTVSIAKSGITTTLNCRTTILAAANPVYGRYNPYKSPVENIDLPAALLSRFDLIFLLLDIVEGDKDKNLALHVCKVHTNAQRQEKEEDEDAGGPAAPQDDDGDALGLGFKPMDHKLLRAYVQKARTFEPLLDDNLVQDMADAYVSMRDDEKREGIESKKSYTTPRTLLAIMRLSQACARARFSNRVERQDFDEAMRLIKASKESIELSAPAKRGQNPLDLVYEIVADLSRRDQAKDAGGWVDMAHVVSMAGHKALTRDMVFEAIENWESLSVLNLNPEKTMVKFLVPPMM
eukprot:TRINITY_DN587_c0_g2_i2.p1 TRINITY_DN587_c0_g2~~TRINITY_DN587_c0_g2_i2.p1  ORF type:complete len:794 (-),score=171.86 TRINITY_DN587_c0_g2_i2:198-2579(-)